MRALIWLVLWASPAFGARYVTTSPQTTELLFQLGHGSEIVGTVAGSQYPPEAASIPSVGQLFAPSLEKTFALKPDWVILDTHNINEPFARAIQSHGLRTFTWNTFSPQDLLKDADRFSQEVSGQPHKKLWPKWKQCLSGISKPARQTSFLGFVWLDPPIVLGPTSFLSRLLEDLGFVNIVGSHLKSPYVSVTEEWLIQAKIDRVIYVSMMHEEPEVALKRFRHWWPNRLPSLEKLDGGLFARASLTPFINIQQLRMDLPQACHEIP